MLLKSQRAAQALPAWLHAKSVAQVRAGWVDWTNRSASVSQSVIYSCPFVPAEWVAAHGLRPCRAAPERSACLPGRGLPEGLCAFAGQWLLELRRRQGRALAAVLTTVCDQMRRLGDLAEPECDLPVFVLHVPHTWQSPTARRIYADELRRLGRFLVRLGGREPSRSELADTIRRFDDARRELLGLRGNLSPRAFAQALADFAREPLDCDLQAVSVKSTIDNRQSSIPLALLGGPIMRGDEWIYDEVDELGGRIVLDVTETGELGLPGPIDRRRLAEDPLEELVTAYLDHIPHPFRRPNTEFYAFLARELVGRGVQGVLFRRYVWCDTWHGELARLREWAEKLVPGRPIPVVDLDCGQSGGDRGRILQRVQAMIETLQQTPGA